MKVCSTILPGIVGTSFMTGYSYGLSAAKQRNFKEPEILGKLIYRLFPEIKELPAQVTGWTLHFLVGVGFSSLYAYGWGERLMKPNLKNALLLGTASGIIAMVVWKSVLKSHPLPPATDFKKYYYQLLPAHIIFAAFATVSYNFLKLHRPSNTPGKKSNH